MIPKIKLNNDETYIDYMKSNKLEMWNFIINAIVKLSENDDKKLYTAFILYNDEWSKEFVVKKENINETINKALKEMEYIENYEKCDLLIKASKKFDMSK